MGGKGAQPTNNQMVQFEQEQAAEARQKEEERKARLELGTKNIGQIFHGEPVMAPQKARLTNVASLQHGTPTEYFDYQNQDAAKAGPGKDKLGDTGWTWRQYTPAGGYGIYDPTGYLAGQGGQWEDAIAGLEGKEYMKDAPTGATKDDPFGAAFTDPYKKAYLDYNTTDLNKQYNKQLDSALYGYARAGTRGGTSYADTLTDIGGLNQGTPYGKYGDALVGIRSGADKAVTDVKNMVASQEQQAMNQLYQTEDPEKAANAARQLSANIPTTPNLSPLGDFFKPLVIGASNIYSGYSGQNTFNQLFGSKSPNASSGQVSKTE